MPSLTTAPQTQTAMTLETKLLDLLDNHKNTEGYIKVSSTPIDWLIYFRYGKIVYATSSLQPFERLDRHLKRLSHQFPHLTLDFRSALSQQFASEVSGDLQAVQWLVQERHLDESTTSRLVARLCEEVIGTQLLLLHPDDCSMEVVPSRMVPKVCSFEPQLLLQGLRKRLAAWQSLAPVITSPYERPCLGFDSKSEISQKLKGVLRGFNFRQLSAIHNEDDILIARRLYPLIQKGTIIVRPPQNPFDLLPTTAPSQGVSLSAEETSPPGITEIAQYAGGAKTWKIVCVDDSEAMLMELKRFLADETLDVCMINDPKKAMMKINSIKPDLILMDVGMPHIDGYQLCSLLRKSPSLKTIPIVMVTGNKGIIDRARARMVGATDYLTKPFTQEELNNMVFRYLS